MRQKRRLRPLKKLQLAESLIFCAALIAFILLFNSAQKYAKPLNLEQLPIVSKNTTKFKTQPDNTAGLVIMHQNKTIYDNIKSQPKKDPPKSNIHLEEDLLVTLRSQYLQIKQPSKVMENPFNIIDEASGNYTLNFGTTSNQAAAETKIQRLISNYKELIKSKFKILQLSKDRYTIELVNSMSEESASAICEKIKINRDECYVLRLP